MSTQWFWRSRPIVLVVDDDPTTRLLANAALRRLDVEIIEAATGEEALTQARDQRPNLVLLDVGLPDTSGFQVCEELRADHESREVPILFVTGLDDLKSIHRAYDTGATDFMTKPVNWSILTERVRYMLRSAREHALLRDREEQLAVAQRAAKLGSWRVDLQINAHEASTSTLGMLGLIDPTEFDVNKFAVGAEEDDKVRVERALSRLTGEGRSFRLDFRYRTPDGKERFLALSGDAVLDANGTLLGCAGGCQDLTERKMRDDQLRFLTSYDPVTGLANRSLFEEHVASAVRHDAAQGEQSAVIVLTMPNLRLDTVTVGARGADRVVQEIGARLSHIAADWVRPASGDGPPPVVARIGEHEFGLVVRQVPDLADLGDLVTAIQYAASQPVTVDKRAIAMTTAAGVAIHPQDGPSASALIAAAGHAARTAEQSGMGTWHFFDISQQVAARRRLSVVTRLRDALEKGEIDLALQAKFDAVGREICGFEALARLKSEDGKSISPAEFVPVAESIGVIDRLSDWVFDRVAQIYLQSGLEVPPIAANLSPVQLGRPGIAERILSRLAECGVATNNVQVEVTESALLDHPDIAVSELDTLRSHGVSIALDDFGTGYASLSTLHQLPIDILKIDRTFIMEVDTDSRAATVVRSVVQLAHGLGIEVVAEGVETARQADVLTEMEVDQLQGFWLARPAPIEDALSLIGADPGRD